jgi:hypothetical protein
MENGICQKSRGLDMMRDITAQFPSLDLFRIIALATEADLNGLIRTVAQARERQSGPSYEGEG